MSLLLGPMPEVVRQVVTKLVEEAQRGQTGSDDRLTGYLLAGGAGGGSYLNADGEVWHWSYGFEGGDEFITRVEDGPGKVSLVALAAEQIPELAEWLPRRPPTARDCHICRSSGWIHVQSVRIQCPKCLGMGWLLGGE